VSRPIRIATRRSELALCQARLVAEAIRRAQPDVEVELVTRITRGDRTAGALADAGGKGLFTAELEAALREGRADLAVHSAKDVPAELADDLPIVATLPRGDPRDVLVSRQGGSLADLPRGARVGTSSPRRRVQLLEARPDLEVIPVRGNVPTRLNRLFKEFVESLDALVLAMCGLKRLGLAGEFAGHLAVLDVERFTPAAGQGILAIQASSACERAVSLAREVDDRPTHNSLLAERSVIRRLGADCHSAVGVHVRADRSEWIAQMMLYQEPANRIRRERATAPTPAGAAEGLVEKLSDGPCGGFCRS
jgi:hydroxymethylbilane synthase